MAEQKTSDKGADKASEAPASASKRAEDTDTFDPRGYVGTTPDDTDRATYALPDPGK